MSGDRRHPTRQGAYGTVTHVDPELAYSELMDAGAKYAEAQRQAELADRKADATWAAVFLAIDKKGRTVPEREALAEVSKQYAEAKDLAINLKADALGAKCAWEASEVRLDFIRTAESTYRALARHVDRQGG